MIKNIKFSVPFVLALSVISVVGCGKQTTTAQKAQAKAQQSQVQPGAVDFRLSSISADLGVDEQGVLGHGEKFQIVQSTGALSLNVQGNDGNYQAQSDADQALISRIGIVENEMASSVNPAQVAILDQAVKLLTSDIQQNTQLIADMGGN